MTTKEVYCPKNVTENITELGKYIYTKLKVTIEDKREFIGYFMCIDKDKNIILSAANEYTFKEKDDENTNVTHDEEMGNELNLVKDDYNSRFVGLIMIPGKYIKKVEAQSYPYF